MSLTPTLAGTAAASAICNPVVCFRTTPAPAVTQATVIDATSAPVGGTTPAFPVVAYPVGGTLPANIFGTSPAKPIALTSSVSTSAMIYFYCDVMRSTYFYKLFNLNTECIDVVQRFDDKVF